MTDISAPIFRNEDKARAYLEAQRWPDGPYCPFCGQTDTAKPLPPKGSMGKGWYHCKDCRKKFTVRVGTLYERSHVPLHKWLLATHLLCASKKGMSAHQLHRMLGVTYKTAWFMAHRIREGMRDDAPVGMGSDGGAVEVDETFVGRKASKKPRKQKKGRGPAHMNSILSLVDRDTGRARSFVIKDMTAKTIYPIVRQNVYREARLMTDDARHYKTLGYEFAEHGIVHHKSGEYVKRRDRTNYTNTIEGFFSIFKRGMKGVYQHCNTKHLHRYLAEFDFRYSNRAALDITDAERRDLALKNISGRRLTYRRTAPRQASA